jgi:hypothetical protein
MYWENIEIGYWQTGDLQVFCNTLFFWILRQILLFTSKVLFALHLNPKSADAPIYDVTVSSAAASLAIRDRFGFLINESRRSKTPLPPFLSGVYISNLVNLSTVVKVEVLKVLKEQYNSRYTKTSNRTAFVKSFTSRPTFHVRPLQRGAGSHQTYGYPEAVSHFRDLLTFENLEPAYKRVGLNFIGELQYRFLVLTEAGRDRYQSSKGLGGRGHNASQPVPSTSSNSVPLGKAPPVKPAGRGKRLASSALSDGQTPAKQTRWDRLLVSDTRAITVEILKFESF